MMTPNVSVIIPIYNGEKYIAQAVRSALLQPETAEVILIDGSSTDATERVCTELAQADARVIYVREETCTGAGAGRNAGVRLAKYDYVAFLDADDWWAPGKLTAQLKAMEKTGAVMCGTARELMTKNGKPTNHVIGTPKIVTYRALLHTNLISCSSVVIRREVALEFPMEHDEVHEDYYTWFRMLKKYGFACGVNAPYLKYRLSDGGKSRNKLKAAKMTFRVYQLIGLRGVALWWHFLQYMLNGVKKYW